MNTINTMNRSIFNIKEYDENIEYKTSLTNEQVLQRVLQLQKVALNVVKKKYNAVIDSVGNIVHYDVIDNFTKKLSFINSGRGSFNWIFIKNLEEYKIEQLDNGYIRFTDPTYPTLSKEKYCFYIHQNDIRQSHTIFCKELRQEILKDKSRHKKIHYKIYGDKEIKTLEQRLKMLKNIRHDVQEGIL